MDIGPLIPLIFIVLWIISALAKKQAGVEGQKYEEEDGTSPSLPPRPEETLEGFLRRLAGEEEKPKAVLLPEIKPVAETVKVPPPPKVEEPPLRVKTPPVPFPLEKEKREEIRRPIPESADLETLRQGIILAEILGPPRARRPL
ncbi:hypothetical protein KAU86_00855 [bacterium]|nr:hypothetical protein [bacterium]